MLNTSDIESRLRAAINDAEVLQVEDMTGTHDHFSAVIVAASFAGMSRVAQHQRVYKALAEWMAGPIHALALQTYTPETYAQKK